MRYEHPKLMEKFNISYGRARVLVDVKKPLTDNFWVERSDKPEIRVVVKYA